MTPEIKEKLLGLINEKAYNPLKKEELALIFDIHSCEMPMFNNFLEELQDDGYLIVSKKGRVMAPSAMGYFVGKFISHRKGCRIFLFPSLAGSEPFLASIHRILLANAFIHPI